MIFWNIFFPFHENLANAKAPQNAMMVLKIVTKNAINRELLTN